MPLPAAVFFDLDGTLVDSVPDLCAALNTMLHQLDLPSYTESTVRDWVGRGPWKLVEDALAPHGVDEATVALASGYFRVAYGDAVSGDAVTSVLYEGVEAVLQYYVQQAVPTVVITNKDLEFAAPLLASLGVSNYFALQLGGDSCAARKPDPIQLQHAANVLGIQPEHALMVGDSMNDVRAAQAAGTPSVLVDYGYHGQHDVHAMGADRVISSLLELIPAQ